MLAIPLLACLTLAVPAAAGGSADPDAALAGALYAEAMDHGRAYELLEQLCDDVGPRLSGSEGAAKAVAWARATFERLGIPVRLEPVSVPRWVRGDVEEVTITAPREVRCHALALGGSVATPPEGIEAPVIVVETFEELRARADEANGKIVLFNRAMGPDGEGGTLGYGDVVIQRTQGAVEAAKVGAVASIIRSVGTAAFRLPHTGVMHYADGVRKIPHAAISSEDADLIARWIARGKEVRVRVRLDCRDEGEVESANVIGEWRGAERPDEVVVVCGHLDSWDVGQGAHDDGVGVVSAIETLRLLKTLGLRPRRTIRAVLYMNEENGLAGGRAYARDHADELDRHVAAIEMDGGAFGFQGFGVSAGEGGLRRVEDLVHPFALLLPTRITEGGGGADISPMRAAGVPQIGLRSDGTRYFHYHHTEADTLDKVDPVRLQQCAAAMAYLAYRLADADEPLPRLPATGSGSR